MGLGKVRSFRNFGYYVSQGLMAQNKDAMVLIL
jgi:hypothetical protein